MLRNKMKDDFLRNCLVLRIEREIVMKVRTDSIINDFNMMKKHALKFK
jgi:hypothetical protein